MTDQIEDNKINKKIGIIGVGYVGGAILKFFASTQECNMLSYDRRKYVSLPDSDVEFIPNSIEEVAASDFIFLCLPTPYIQGFGFDYTALNENLLKLARLKYSGIVIIKSTVEPGMTRAFSDKYKLKIVHNPEFLTARTAAKDFAEQGHIVIGGLDIDVCKEVISLYQKYFNATYTICDAEQAELMKLFCNNFYAVKVQLFNEFALTCKRIGVSYNDVRDIMLRNGWINPMHTDVPGPDGEFSYGGACFPKDTNALHDFMKRNGVPCEIIEACIKERNLMRRD
jgi:nucleotide sugar dehydrogenase